MGLFTVCTLCLVFFSFSLTFLLTLLVLGQVFADVISASIRPMFMLLFIMGIGLIVFSSAIYYAERGTYNEDERVYEIEGEDR